jgi:HEAT repeat protein
MNKTVILSEEDLIADLQSPQAEVRRKAARDLGVLTTGDEREVSALMDVMQNDGEVKVREMAYWALSSPANLAILSQHPDWQARVLQPGYKKRKRPKWWTALLNRLKLP